MRWITCTIMAFFPAIAAAADPPNVLIVITDDQGYGDLGAHGNPVVKTPRLDAFAKQSVWLRNFYVSPVCSPTRASLLTGFYNYRTGVVDTFLGRSMMRPDVKTLAEYLAGAGYRTGLFGKWHLGDNYPLRPEDRGFQETLWSRGGGLAQPSDPPQVDPKNAYFDPVLTRNGKEVKTKGYCTDVFTDAAEKFITAESKKPFFAYVAYNCPHSPYQVPEEFEKPYSKLDLTANGFPRIGQPWATKKLNVDEISKAYGMIENVDANFGRLMKALDDAKLADNTLVIFLTDNGPGGVRWNAGLRNRKGTVYEGGIRVPCYVRWPKEAKAGSVVARRWPISMCCRPFFTRAKYGSLPETAGAFAPSLAGRMPRGRTGRCSSSGIAGTSPRSSAPSPSTGVDTNSFRPTVFNRERTGNRSTSYSTSTATRSRRRISPRRCPKRSPHLKQLTNTGSPT